MRMKEFLAFTMAASLLATRASAGEVFRATIRGDCAASSGDLVGTQATIPPVLSVPGPVEPVTARLYFEYWSRWPSPSAGTTCGQDQSARFAGATVTVGSGQPVPMPGLPIEEIGCLDFDTSSCVGRWTLHFFSVDLTSILRDLTLPVHLAGFPPLASNGSGVWGMTVMAAYCSPTGPVRDIVLLEEPQILAATNDVARFAWQDFAPNGSDSKVLLAYGDAEGGERVEFNGVLLGNGSSDESSDSVMDGGNGYGVDLLDVTSLISTSSPQAVLEVFRTSDCIELAAAFLSVVTDAAPGRAIDYGQGVGGSSAFEPRLSLEGCPIGGEVVTLHATDVLGGAHGCLVIGQGRGSIQLLVGQLLVRPPVVSVAHQANGLPGFPGGGSFDLDLAIPLSLVGEGLNFQAAYFDPGAPRGVSLSKGLEFRVGG